MCHSIAALGTSHISSNQKLYDLGFGWGRKVFGGQAIFFWSPKNVSKCHKLQAPAAQFFSPFFFEKKNSSWDKKCRAHHKKEKEKEKRGVRRDVDEPVVEDVANKAKPSSLLAQVMLKMSGRVQMDDGLSLDIDIFLGNGHISAKPSDSPPVLLDKSPQNLKILRS